MIAITVIKTVLHYRKPNYRNLESIKKLSNQLASSSTNMHISGMNLLRAFYKLLYLWFTSQVMSEQALCGRDFTKNLRRIWKFWHEKIIFTIFLRNLVTNSLISLFYLLKKPKARIKFPAILLSDNDNRSTVLFIRGRALFWRYAKLKRLL